MADFNQTIIDEFRANGGVVSTMSFGKGLVLLHHIGAKSGLERVAPVAARRIGPDVWHIAASKGGAPEHPAWYRNLLAHPDVEIETPDDGIVPVHARDLPRDERDEAWRGFIRMSAGFADYERRTTRVIPVVELRRR